MKKQGIQQGSRCFKDMKSEHGIDEEAGHPARQRRRGRSSSQAETTRQAIQPGTETTRQIIQPHATLAYARRRIGERSLAIGLRLDSLRRRRQGIKPDEEMENSQRKRKRRSGGRGSGKRRRRQQPPTEIASPSQQQSDEPIAETIVESPSPRQSPRRDRRRGPSQSPSPCAWLRAEREPLTERPSPRTHNTSPRAASTSPPQIALNRAERPPPRASQPEPIAADAPCADYRRADRREPIAEPTALPDSDSESLSPIHWARRLRNRE